MTKCDYFHSILIAIIAAVSLWCSTYYPGNPFYYLLFSVTINIYLFLGFSKKKIFFETFFATFLWLGFWLKMTIRLLFYNGVYHEPIGKFLGTPMEYDDALKVVIVGILPLILISLIRRRYFSISDATNVPKYKLEGIEKYYLKFRSKIIAFSVLFLLLIAVSNGYVHIYQRGVIPPQNVPFLVYGVYAWLVMFGISTLFALFLNFDLKKSGAPYLVTGLFIWEAFCSSSSMLSRGMILNASAGLFGVLNYFFYFKKKVNLKYITVGTSVFAALFISSIYLVNFFRSSIYTGDMNKRKVNMDNLAIANEKVGILFVDRWVGAEGIFAVASYPNKGWDIMNKAWKEKMRNGHLSVYDSTFITSSYENVDFEKHHFISIPGAIAFFYYPGKLWFLFLGMAALGLIGWLIEYTFFIFSGHNLILVSLMSQVVAFRFAHLGYVPSQSYQLFGTIFLNLLLIILLNKILNIISNKGNQLTADL